MTRLLWTVTADGLELEAVVAGGTIRRGRTDASETSRAGYLSLRLLGLGRVPEDVSLGRRLTVEVRPDDAGTPTARRVATMVLTDRTDRLEADRARRVISRQLTAVGLLGQTPRSPVRDGGYPAQLDGERVLACLEDVYQRPWLYTPGTWQDQPAGRSWLEVDPELSGIGAGLYGLAQDTDADDPLGVLRKAQADAGSVLFETAAGAFRYQTGADRAALVNAASPTVLPNPIGEGVTTRRQLSDLVTHASVTYVGGTATASDETHAAQLGRRYQERRSTSLTSSTDAQERADRIVAFGVNPRPTWEASWPLHVLDPADADTLLELELGDYVDVGSAVPIDVDRYGFVEMLELRPMPHGAATLTATISPVTASVQLTGAWLTTPGRWDEQPAGTPWTAY